MRISSMELKNFKPFSLSDIQHLTMYPTSDIQIFIGDNGSGKSSLLNELHPLAAIKPMYNKKGLKQIKLIHDSKEYILTSDFSNSAGAHSFVVDNTELNISGGAGIQNELVEYHLGYSDLIHDITHLNYKMCKMSKTDRKSLLLNINPVDLSLVLEKHKAICSKLRECKNNLTLLHKKKQEIETQLLSKDIRVSLQKERDKYLVQYNSLNSEIYHLQQLLKDINVSLRDYHNVDENIVDIKQLKDTFKEMNVFLSDCKDIKKRDSESIENITSSLTMERQYIEKDSEQYKERILTITQEIQTYVKHIEELGTGVTVESLEAELVRLRQNKVDIDSTLPVIPEDQYDFHISSVNSAINYIYQYKETYGKFTIQEKSINPFRQKLMSVQFKVSSFSKKLIEIEEKLNELNVQFSTIPNQVDIFDICGECEYFKHFHTQLLTIGDKKETLLKLKTYYSKKMDIYSRVEEKLSAFFERASDAYADMLYIGTYLDNTIFRTSYETFRQMYVLDFNRIILRLKSTVTQAPHVYNNQKLDKQIEEISSRIIYMLSTGTPSIDLLKELTQKKKLELDSTWTQLNKVSDKLQTCEQKYYKHKEFLYWLNTLSAYQEQLSQYMNFTILKANKDFCLRLIETKQSELAILNSTLLDIDNTLKDQESLLIRLKDTVSTIKEIEETKKNFQIIENGISPYSGFPHKQMIDYINVLIHNVNYVLSQVWTYPLQINTLTEDTTLDCTLSIMVDDILVPDISRLSKGQQAIVDLAFVFAFMISKKIVDYPLFLDEILDGLDPTHTERTLEWLKSLTDNGYTSQMWLVHHEAVLFDFFQQCEILSLMSNNIVQCEKINTHVSFN